MQKWIFWAGVAFLIGGFVSLSINSVFVQTEFIDSMGYSIGWIVTGIVLMIFGILYGGNKH